MQDDDLAIHWLSSDGNTALATRSRLVAGQASQALIQRFADGRPDRVLIEGLISPSTVSVSPDGKTVAFWGISGISSETETTNSLYLVRASTAEVRLVVEGTVASWWLKWSPDGRKVLFEGRDPEGYGRLTWTSWEAPSLHMLRGAGTLMYNPMRGQLSWAPDSRHVLIFDQNPMIESKRAELVTVDLEGNSVSSRPIVDAQGEWLQSFAPLAVQADNPSVLGHSAILEAGTAIVRPLSDEVLGWAHAPNTVLRWRMLPGGPVLDEVKLERLVR
jgi:dipeptidyl aminopeptidase/acylaminoacyl peptidase